MKNKIEMQQHNEEENKVSTSQELLSVKKQNRGKKIVKSLLRSEIEPQRKRKVFETCKSTESPLILQLQDFLPIFKKSTIDIANKPEDERKKLNIESIDDDNDIETCDDNLESSDDDEDSGTGVNADNHNRVIEMNLFFGQLNEDSSSSDDSSDSEDEKVEELHSKSLQIVKRRKKGEQNPAQKILISEVETSDSINNNSCKEDT